MDEPRWKSDNYRGWYQIYSLLYWKCGLPWVPVEIQEAFYYASSDDEDLDNTPVDWGDTYDIEAEERRARREDREEREREIKEMREYMTGILQDWN
jgi:hypothetical protein